MKAGVQIACALTWNLFSAGIVFGFAALKPVLVSQGVYSNLCDGEDSCVAQDLRLNLMFTLSAGITNIVALIVGYILDNRGPRVCGFIGSVFLALGALLLAFSENLVNIFDPYTIGYVLLAIGGPFVFISTFQLSNLVPQHSGKVLAAITGAFDSSSALFMFYRVINERHALPLKKFFLGYLIVPIFIVICQLFVMPKGSRRSLGAVQKLNVEGLDEDGNLPEGVDPNQFFANEAYRDEIMQRQTQQNIDDPVPIRHSISDTRRRSVLEVVVSERLETRTKGIYGMLHGMAASSQIKTKWFTYALMLTVVCMLRLNYFMATVRSQERYLLGDKDKANQLGAIFDVMLPLGGLGAIPLIGLVIDHIPTVNVLKGMCLTSILVGVLGLFRNYTLNLFGIIILVAYRPFYYTVISDYCSKVFGFETFGTVYGLLMTISGVLNMTQTIIDRLTQTVFGMNPTPINMCLTALTAILSAIWLTFVQRQAHQRRELAIE